MRLKALFVAAAGLALTVVGRAHADDCVAIPEEGPIPPYLAYGSNFSGPVVQVLDGDSLCVAVGDTPLQWVEVRLADFYASELEKAQGGAARDALMRIAFGKRAYCISGLRTHDRIAARCEISGHAVGDLMRDAGVAEAGNGTAAAVEPPVRENGPSLRSRPGQTCAEYRARGGVLRGQPGYRPEWDGDDDGLACEPIRR